MQIGLRTHLLILGSIFSAVGALLVFSAKCPQRNVLTRTMFSVTTFVKFPFAFVKDETIVLVNGIVLFAAGVALLIGIAFVSN